MLYHCLPLLTIKLIGCSRIMHFFFFLSILIKIKSYFSVHPTHDRCHSTCCDQQKETELTVNGLEVDDFQVKSSVVHHRRKTLCVVSHVSNLSQPPNVVTVLLLHLLIWSHVTCPKGHLSEWSCADSQI